LLSQTDNNNNNEHICIAQNKNPQMRCSIVFANPPRGATLTWWGGLSDPEDTRDF